MGKQVVHNSELIENLTTSNYSLTANRDQNYRSWRSCYFPYSNIQPFINICLYLSLKFKVESVSENQVLLCIISSTSNDINAIYLVINLTKSHHLKSLMIIHDGKLLNKYFYFVGQLYHWLHHISLVWPELLGDQKPIWCKQRNF